MVRLNLDSELKTIELELMLEGEKEPLHGQKFEISAEYAKLLKVVV